jgi:hypothetical protein
VKEIVAIIPLDQVEPSMHRRLDLRPLDAKWQKRLAESIRERGLTDRLPVRHHRYKEGIYELVWGHQRFFACRDILKLEEMEFRIVELTDEQMLDWMIIDNARDPDPDGTKKFQRAKEECFGALRVLAVGFLKADDGILASARQVDFAGTDYFSKQTEHTRRAIMAALADGTGIGARMAFDWLVREKSLPITKYEVDEGVAAIKNDPKYCQACYDAAQADVAAERERVEAEIEVQRKAEAAAELRAKKAKTEAAKRKAEAEAAAARAERERKEREAEAKKKTEERVQESTTKAKKKVAQSEADGVFFPVDAKALDVFKTRVLREAFQQACKRYGVPYDRQAEIAERVTGGNRVNNQTIDDGVAEAMNPGTRARDRQQEKEQEKKIDLKTCFERMERWTNAIRSEVSDVKKILRAFPDLATQYDAEWASLGTSLQAMMRTVAEIKPVDKQAGIGS